MRKLGQIFKEQQELLDRHKYVSKEFQDFGYRVALRLDDLAHKSLYIKLAKKENRANIERALLFASDYPKARNKAKIFMWKLKELREGKPDDKKEFKRKDNFVPFVSDRPTKGSA